MQHHLCTLSILLVQTDSSCKCYSVFYECSLYHYPLKTDASVTEVAISKKQTTVRILAQKCRRNSTGIFKYINP